MCQAGLRKRVRVSLNLKFESKDMAVFPIFDFVVVGISCWLMLYDDFESQETSRMKHL